MLSSLDFMHDKKQDEPTKITHNVYINLFINNSKFRNSGANLRTIPQKQVIFTL